ncbi:MAG: tail fiber domain-containing protein [Verrucomicrobia bacterium]|nr:tail fiber domain-containing protein [Verrucomicrobiota bacterium]
MKLHPILLIPLCGLAVAARAQSTAFTYQGLLTENGSPASGSYDLTLTLFNGSSPAAAKIAGPLTNSAVAVNQGLFSVLVDFGASFPGSDRWLEIAARTNGVGAFVPLVPRQPITATPYALTARNLTGVVSNASLAGVYSSAVTFNNAGNSFSGIGAGLTGVNAATLGGLNANQFWKTAGNAGTTPNAQFLGTTDNQALELRVNGLRALRLQPNTNNSQPSLIAGPGSNTISPGTAGATIAGGEKNFIESFAAAGSDFAAIGGGSSNQIGYFSFNGVIGGGFQNALEPNDYYSTIAGGLQNHMGFHAVNSTISGGRSNSIQASVDTATIGGGGDNTVQFLAHYATIAAGRNNLIRSNAEYSAIGGGRDNTVDVGAAYSRIGGGERNQIKNGDHVTIAGGGANSIHADSGTIGGGTSNTIETNASESVIGGGFGNIIHTNANRSTIAGGVFHEVLNDASYSFIGGGTRNKGGSNAYHATISGGSNNTIDHDASYGFIGGGKLHTIGPKSAHATIAGGDGNIAAGEAPAIGGGTLNVIEADTTYAAIAGGGGNRVGANSFSSTIAGGYLNQVLGNFSFAAGNRAQANHPGTFAWAGGNTLPYASIFPNSFNVYSSNGVSMDYGPQSAGQPRGARYVYIGPFNAGLTISVWNGARLTDGGVWSNASDRNRKTGFKDVDARSVLEKLVALPVRQWRYTNETAGVKHLGPVAQDFQSAFGLGVDDTSIGTVDADGVALAAIQGLNQKLRDELDRRDVENAELRRRLERLEQRLEQRLNQQASGER